jgi:hypothetical protein
MGILMNKHLSVLALAAFLFALEVSVVGPAAADHGGNQLRVEGKLTAKTANSVTINNTTLTVNSATKIELAGVPVQLSALVIGARTQARYVGGIATKVEQ